MTSKNSFWKYSNWNFKKRAWTFALCAVIWFLVIPVATFMNVESSLYGVIDGTEFRWITNNIINTHISGSGVYGLLTVVMAIFLGIQSYAWNNHQRKVDMYKAAPVKASCRFWYINLNSFWIYFITFGLSLVAANIIVASHGIWEMIYLKATITSLLMHVLLFMAIYVVALIAQYLTGNLVLGIVGSCILIVFEPLCYLIRDSLKVIFYETYISDYRYEIYGQGIFSPLAPYINGFKSISIQETGWADSANYGDVALPMILLVVQIILYGSLAYVLYQKKPAQMGGKTIAFSKTKPVIKCALLIVGSILAALIMTSFTTNYVVGYGLFGLIFGLLIGHAILQSIMEGGFREIFRGKISLAVSTVIALGIYLGFAYDITGYDTYLPASEEIESFAISRNSDYAYNMYEESGEYISTRDYIAEHMAITNEEAKDTLLNVLQNNIEEEVSHYGGEIQRYERIYVKFRMKDGREVERAYFLPLDDVLACFEVLYMIPGYKESIYMICSDTMEGWMSRKDLEGGISYKEYGMIQKGYNEWQTDLLQEFYQALKKDMMERTSETVSTMIPVGCVEVKLRFGGRDRNLVVPVYENDVNTMKLIKEKGWYRNPGVEKENVKAILLQYSDEDGVKYLGIKPDDELFEAVVAALVYNYALEYVPERSTIIEEDYYVDVLISINGIEENLTCMLERSKIPQELEGIFESMEPIDSPEDYMTIEDVLEQ